VLYEDTIVTGLPVTPNGGNILITWNASGIFQLSDVSAKTDIKLLASLASLGLYEYKYKGSKERQLGFMAHEIAGVLPGCVGKVGLGGLWGVDYPAVFREVAA
jgi:hypothetical protein